MKEVVTFLKELAENNNREWFTAHKKQYKRAHDQFLDFVQELIFGVNQFDDLGALSAKECTFRIYRDVRFSGDKNPYKENMGAYIANGGRRSGLAGYYFHIQPGDSFVAGGQYAPTKEQLAALRESIVEDSGPLRAVMVAEDFQKYFGGLGGEQVKTAPRGFKADHPEIDLLRYKNFVVSHKLTNEQVLAPDLLGNVLEMFRHLKPFNDCLNKMQKTTS